MQSITNGKTFCSTSIMPTNLLEHAYRKKICRVFFIIATQGRLVDTLDQQNDNKGISMWFLLAYSV